MMKDWYEKSIKTCNSTVKANAPKKRIPVPYACSLSSTIKPRISSPRKICNITFYTGEVDQWSPATLRICYSGIRFFFEHVLHRNWHTLKVIHAQREQQLPTVLSREKVRRLLRGVRTPHNYAFLATVYACGLRLQEAQHLEIADIDSHRMMLHIHRRQGAKTASSPCLKQPSLS